MTDTTRKGIRPLALGLGAALILGTGAMLALGQIGRSVDSSGPVHAPCLSGHATETAVIDAMRSAGWTHLQEGDPSRQTAAQATEEANVALIRLQGRFETVEETHAFVAGVADAVARQIRFEQVFVRGALSAMIQVDPQGPDAAIVQCIFAGASVPGIDAILGDDPIGSELTAFVFNMLEPDPGPNTRRLRIDAMRFIGPAHVLAPLSGREAILVTHATGPSQ